jgi:hypothetical protein
VRRALTESCRKAFGVEELAGRAEAGLGQAFIFMHGRGRTVEVTATQRRGTPLQ